MLQNLNQREKVFLIGGAGALLLLVIIFGIILPYRSALARLDDKIALRQNQLQEVQALQAEFGKLRNELSLRERKLARNPDASAFSSIENIVVRLGFRDKLIAMRPQPASEREGMRVEAVSARLERINLEQLVSLLQSFEASNILLNVTSMKVKTRFDDASQLDAEIRIETLKRNG